MRRSYIFYFEEMSLKLSVTLLLISFEFTIDLRRKKNNIKALLCEIKIKSSIYLNINYAADKIHK